MDDMDYVKEGAENFHRLPEEDDLQYVVDGEEDFVADASDWGIMNVVQRYRVFVVAIPMVLVLYCLWCLCLYGT